MLNSRTLYMCWGGGGGWMGGVCCCSVTKSCLTVTPWTIAWTIGCLVLHYLPEFAQIHVHWVSDAICLILCCLLLLLPLIFPSVRVFYSESALHMRWPKSWSFSFSISPSNEYSGLIFFFRNIYVYIYIIYLCIYVFLVESEKFAWLVGFTLRKRALYVEKLLHVQPVTFFPLCFVCCKCNQNSEMWFSFEGPEAKPIIMFSFCSVI